MERLARMCCVCATAAQQLFGDKTKNIRDPDYIYNLRV